MSHERIAALLDASRTAEGRQGILESGELDKLAALAADRLAALPPSKLAGADDGDEVLVLLLRLLRNCCALGAPAAAVLMQHKLHTILAATIAAMAASSAPTSCPAAGTQQLPGQSTPTNTQQLSDLLLPAAQMLCNLSSTGAQAAAGVWQALFTAALCSLLLAGDERVHEAAALTALVCARSTSKTLADLASPAARPLWLRLLGPLMPQPEPHSADKQHNSNNNSNSGHQQTAAAAPAVPAGNDNLCLLVKFVAMQQNHLQQLMELIAGPAAAVDAGSTSAQQTTVSSSTAAHTNGAPAALHVVEEHAVLLHVVAVEAAGVPAAEALPGVPADLLQLQQEAGTKSAGSNSDASSCWLQYVVRLLQQVWQQALAAAVPAAGVCSKPTVTAHVLEALLQVLKAAMARDEDTAGGGKAADAAAAAGLAATARYLHSAGLLQQLLQMLKALGPPPKTKQQQQRLLEQQQGQQQQQQQGQQQQQQPPQSQPPPEEPPQHEQPYAGYRADVVALLSNLCLGGPTVQTAVMQAGGIEQLLTNCNLDESSPLAREWALWGIRNVCKDNEGVQAYLSQFQAVDAVQTPELDSMGVQLELDQATHKLKLSRKSTEGE